jgi:hypothetical protein
MGQSTVAGSTWRQPETMPCRTWQSRLGRPLSDAEGFSDTCISVSVVGQFHVNSLGAASWIDHTLNVNFKLTHYLGVAALVSVRLAWYV